MAQYRKFFPLLDQIAKEPAAARGAQLATVATKPLYDTVLTNLAQNDAKGIAFYGPPGDTSRARIKVITTDTAVIEDCQDGSRSGTKRKSDGKLLTVGKKNSGVTSTLALGADGVWRLSILTYGGQVASCG